jgi:hypothetical protein
LKLVDDLKNSPENIRRFRLKTAKEANLTTMIASAARRGGANVGR